MKTSKHDPMEPQNTTVAVVSLGVDYIVLTRVDRGDLPDVGSCDFEEAKKELNLVPSVPQKSLAHQKYENMLICLKLLLMNILSEFHHKAPVCISSPAPSRASNEQLHGVAGDEDEYVVRITNGKQAKVAAKRIFLNVAKPGSKSPFIACEIFTCEVDIILEALVEDEEVQKT
ncbi:lipoyl synthase, chloroplastic-like [Helianthus annuus]|uniref:lipoyl synthase, chloroplastic-like n=1 Tax=Helianthus annuus TaxID=4232 RepID=UPI000B8F3C05|nr:lipoyl synthase, chloroplastic-like [Helianthus annuus]